MLVRFRATRTAVLLAWGGHLAQSAYWDTATGGPPDGAAQVSGAPWHMRTLKLDGAGNKNQDRSIQPSAIVGTLPPRASRRHRHRPLDRLLRLPRRRRPARPPRPPPRDGRDPSTGRPRWPWQPDHAGRAEHPCRPERPGRSGPGSEPHAAADIAGRPAGGLGPGVRRCRSPVRHHPPGGVARRRGRKAATHLKAAQTGRA